MTAPWNEERTELLRRLWLAGEAARTIAEKLGDGVTRNAVIGKAHRLGLTGKQGSKSAAFKRSRVPSPKKSNQQPERKPRARNSAR